MVKQSSSVSKTKYPVRPEGFDYAAPQSQGPTLGLGGSFLVSYPYMQYTNPNNSRFSPMDTLTYQDKSEVMQSMADYVLDTMAYETAMNRALMQEQSKYYRDVAALVNEAPDLQRLSKSFESVNPTASVTKNAEDADKVVYTEVSLPPKVVRKGSQDIVIPQTQQTVREVENFEMSSSPSARIFRPGMLGFLLAVLIVLGIIYYASKAGKASSSASSFRYGFYY